MSLDTRSDEYIARMPLNCHQSEPLCQAQDRRRLVEAELSSLSTSASSKMVLSREEKTCRRTNKGSEMLCVPKFFQTPRSCCRRPTTNSTNETKLLSSSSSSRTRIGIRRRRRKLDELLSLKQSSILNSSAAANKISSNLKAISSALVLIAVLLLLHPHQCQCSSLAGE